MKQNITTTIDVDLMNKIRAYGVPISKIIEKGCTFYFNKSINGDDVDEAENKVIIEKLQKKCILLNNLILEANQKIELLEKQIAGGKNESV